jgi:thiol-disulfide isomerase/thioredoxin
MVSSVQLLVCWLSVASGFSLATMSAPVGRRLQSAAARTTQPVAVVIDVSSTEEFNDELAKAGDALVVVDYSTSWCGPCKIIAPKFDEFSEQYKNVAFLKVRAHRHTSVRACHVPASVCAWPTLPHRDLGHTRRPSVFCCRPILSGDGRQQPRC